MGGRGGTDFPGGGERVRGVSRGQAGPRVVQLDAVRCFLDRARYPAGRRIAGVSEFAAVGAALSPRGVRTGSGRGHVQFGRGPATAGPAGLFPKDDPKSLELVMGCLFSLEESTHRL